MPRPLLLIGTLLLGYAALCLLLYLFQRSLIYFPRSRGITAEANTMLLPSEAGDIVVTVRRLESPDAVIYFGGNAEDVSVNLIEFTVGLPGHAAYLLHYRGYGGSAGSPTEEGIIADALALFDTVQAKHERVSLIGRSLGSGVAVQVAARRPVHKAVLVTPFESLVDVAAGHYFFFPVRLLMKDRYDSGRLASKVSSPTLFIAAEHDEIVPRSSTDSLLARFEPGVATMRVIPGTGHNTLGGQPEYLRLIRTFIIGSPVPGDGGSDAEPL